MAVGDPPLGMTEEKREEACWVGWDFFREVF